MNAKEGVTRLAKLISAIGWLIFLGFIVGAFSGLIGRSSWGMSLLLLLCAVVALAIFQGIVWIFDGFAGNKKQDGALLWPYKPKSKQISKSEIADKASQRAAADLHLRGVHGWLLWLVVVFMVLGPLVGFGQLANSLDAAEKAFPGILNIPGWGHYKTASWVLAWMSASALFLAGYRLLKFHDPFSVRLAIVVLWVTPIATLAADFYSAGYFLNIAAAEYAGRETVTALFRGLLSALVWTAYLKLSRRVRNTYYTGFQANSMEDHARSEPTL